MKWRSALTACAALTCVPPAYAQGAVEAALGSHIRAPRPANAPDNLHLSNSDSALTTLDRFADCLIGSSPRKAAEFLDAAYDAPDNSEMLLRLARNDCLWGGIQLGVTQDLLRGALFKSYFLRDFDDTAVTLSETPVDFTPYVDNGSEGNGLRYRVMMEFASCLVRAHTADVVAYVRADPGSATAKTALAALTPNLGSCFPQGAQLTLYKPVLRATLAEAVYREAQAGKQSSAEVTP